MLLNTEQKHGHLEVKYRTTQPQRRVTKTRPISYIFIYTEDQNLKTNQEGKKNNQNAAKKWAILVLTVAII